MIRDRRARAPRAAERGMTLVEVMVALSLMVAIVPVFVPLLLSATRSARALGLQSQTLDQLRLAVATIGRELRSAECIYEPVANGAAGPTLRFRTDAFLSVAGSPSSYDVTYTATVGQLRRQVSGQDATTAASGLVNPSGAFQQIFTPRRSVKLLLQIRTGPEDPVRDVATTIAGRNAWRDC
jgi:prepilin-type N-terminal cleavage/methylation domain-containing protein